MLLWQCDQHKLLFRIAGITILLHCFCLFFLFFYTAHDSVSIAVTKTIIESNKKIIFRPLPHAPSIKKGGTTNVATLKQGTARSKSTPVKKTQDKTMLKAPAKKQIQKKGKIQKKSTAPVPSKKTSPKKELPLKKPVPFAPAVAHAEPVQKSLDVPQDQTAVNNVLDQETIIIDPAQYTALQLQTYFQEELSQVWHPPQGLPLDLECKITLALLKDGSIKNSTIVQSSGVAIYDMSVLQALETLTIPSVAWGKEITITFKQG